MHCINCGNQLKGEEKFCTSCGKAVVHFADIGSNKKKSHGRVKAVILTALVTSVFWFFYYFGFVDKSSQSINVVSHLIETVGRQREAWTKAEEITELFSVGISDECLYTAGCVDEAVSRITTLRAEIDKESAEIDNLWSENVFGLDFEEYYLSLDEKSQIQLFDIMNTYFPEESEELETTSATLL
jgi:hypothetical protein